MANGNSADLKFEQWKGAMERHAKAKKVATIVSVVTGLGWLLFLYKMNQTSEMALRYSTEAQESVGSWTLVLLAMSIGSAVLIVVSGRAKKRAKALAASLAPELRGQLDDADAGQRSMINDRY
ncbi:hypothetical protein EB810_11190 [Altererythrobacter sp. FM1]|uniref:Holin-X, holin superfamily III n=1 Tax=Tsuneonella flava TaxID=2055955 RepID=A0ABX7KC29_9SPHN|nr:hypothetical protein [Tsuneonella flava]QSB44744.1 hypothetical protein IDJ81_00710 [Tsuneonella flava]ROT93700.1 hypothetical protein EB810_11190 [Altererythrobacter sp. FM1]